MLPQANSPELSASCRRLESPFRWTSSSTALHCTCTLAQDGSTAFWSRTASRARNVRNRPRAAACIPDLVRSANQGANLDPYLRGWFPGLGTGNLGNPALREYLGACQGGAYRPRRLSQKAKAWIPRVDTGNRPHSPGRSTPPGKRLSLETYPARCTRTCSEDVDYSRTLRPTTTATDPAAQVGG